MKQVVEIAVAEMRQPTDVSGLRQLLTEQVRAEDVVTVIGKSEGTGLGKDNGREAAHQAIKETLAEALGIDSGEVANRVSFILSGGCPGVITPHVALATRRFVTDPTGPADAVYDAESAGKAEADEGIFTGRDLDKRLVVGLPHSKTHRGA